MSKTTKSYTLRHKMFLANGILISLLLILVAWLINKQIVTSINSQLNQEIIAARPLYQAAWQQKAQVLANACNNLVKADELKRALATSDPNTIEDTVRELLQSRSASFDLLVVTDKEGHVVSSSQRDLVLPKPVIEAAIEEQQTGFIVANNKLFQIVATPLLIQTGTLSSDTLALFIIGFDTNTSIANDIKQQTSADIAFLANNQIYSSTFPNNLWNNLGEIAKTSEGKFGGNKAFNFELQGQQYVSFLDTLVGLDGKQVGSLVIARSLSSATKFLDSIRNFFIIIWIVGLIAVLISSYLLTSSIFKPLELLVTAAKELGKGNFENKIEIKGSKEIKILAETLDETRTSLRDANNRITDMVYGLQQIVQEVSATAVDVGAASNEIAGLSKKSAKDGEIFTSSIQETAIVLEEFSSNIQNINRHLQNQSAEINGIVLSANNLSQSANNITELSKGLSKVITEAVQHVHDAKVLLSAAIGQGAENILSIERALTKLDAIVKQIEWFAYQIDISTQGQLLATNRTQKATQTLQNVTAEIVKAIEEQATTSRQLVDKVRDLRIRSSEDTSKAYVLSDSSVGLAVLAHRLLQLCPNQNTGNLSLTLYSSEEAEINERVF